MMLFRIPFTLVGLTTCVCCLQVQRSGFAPFTPNISLSAGFR